MYVVSEILVHRTPLGLLVVYHFQHLSAMIVLPGLGEKVHSNGATCSSHWNDASNGSATRWVLNLGLGNTWWGSSISKIWCSAETAWAGTSPTSSYIFPLWTAWASGLQPETATSSDLSKTPINMPASSDVFGVAALLSGFQVHRLGHTGFPKPTSSRSDLMLTLT